MSIIIVSGPACSGKSSFIKENFSDKTIIDLKTFQDNYRFLNIENVTKSYEDCKNALVEAIKNGKDVVLEHTLLKAIRRKYYIDAIKKVTNENVEIYFFIPSFELLKERSELRGIENNDFNIKSSLEILEEPEYAEGFSKIYLIKEDVMSEKTNVEKEVKKFVAGICKEDDAAIEEAFKNVVESDDVTQEFINIFNLAIIECEEAEKNGNIDELLKEWNSY